MKFKTFSFSNHSLRELATVDGRLVAVIQELRADPSKRRDLPALFREPRPE